MERLDYIASDDYAPDNIGLEFFRVASHASPYLMAITENPTFALQYANGRLTPMLGYQNSDWTSERRFFLDDMEEAEQGQIQDIIAPLLKTNTDQTSAKGLLRVRNKEGKWLYLETTFSVFRRDPEGNPVSFLSLSDDVTDRVLREEKSRQFEQMVNITEEAFHFGKWEYEVGTGKTQWSEGIYDIFDLPMGHPARNTFTSEQYVSYLSVQDREQLTKDVERALATGTPYSYEHHIQLPWGGDKWLRGYGKPLLNSDGQVYKIVGTTWDITEEYLKKQTLQKYAFQLADAERFLKLGTWEWNMQERKVKWSTGFWNLLEYPETEQKSDWISMDQYYDHIEPEEEAEARNRERNALQRTEDAEQVLTEVKIRTRQGNVRYLLSSTRVIEWKDGKPIYAIGYSADVTDMRLTQAALEQKVNELDRAYQEAEQFAYVASHDLQEPLRKVTSFGERLRDRCGTNFDDSCQQYLTRMLDATGRMRTLIDNLLTLSRTKRAPNLMESVDLAKIINDVQADVELKIQEKQATITTTALPIVEGVSIQLHQLFYNLIFNALKFAKRDVPSAIEIAARPVTQKEQYKYDLELFAEYVLITVKDNGIGFEPQYAQDIFTPFKKLHARSEYEGTGIGLAICKKVVQNHKGVMWAESELEQGATFYVILPLSQPK